MRMKYHKIRSVDMDVCTAEQKIAYNIAFTVHINYGDRYLEIFKEYPRIVSDDFLKGIIQSEIKNYVNNYPDSKYNIDAIFASLNYGLRDYLVKEKYHIFTDYETIGRVFPANYL